MLGGAGTVGPGPLVIPSGTGLTELDLGIAEDRRELILLPEPDETLVREVGHVRRDRFVKPREDQRVGVLMFKPFMKPNGRTLNGGANEEDPAQNGKSQEKNRVDIT